MLISEFYPIPVGISLGVIGALLGASIAASLLRTPAQREGDSRRAR
jgi:hypothetical protein